MRSFKVVFAGLLVVFSIHLATAQATVQNNGKLSGFW